MKTLKYIAPKLDKAQKDELFATFDIETYVQDESPKFVPYCAAAYVDGQKMSAYVGDIIGSHPELLDDVIIMVLFKVCDYVKSIGRNSLILYAHNLASFDAYFLLRSFGEAGLNVGILKRESEIFFVKVTLYDVKLEFRCSLLLLRQDLNSCAKSFGVSTRKLPMVHGWVTKERLHYCGVTPFSDGKSIVFRDYAIDYCMNDCIMLYDILQVFHQKLKEFGLGLNLNVYSIPGMALKAFKKNYLKPKMVVNLSTAHSMEKFIREGYYGGRSEVFMGYIGDGKGYYYDVKGMYAQAMRMDLPCGQPYWLTTFDDDWLNPNMSKGFFRVKVYAPYMHYPVLPHRNKDGKLIFPCGN